MKTLFYLILSAMLATGPGNDRQGILEADGDDINTYELIESCGFIYQVPDKIGGHSEEHERHIHQSYDEVLGQYVFEFTLHKDTDIDFCLPDRTDRQRNEIAIAGKDPSPTVAGEGETLKVSWKFFLPEGMKVTDRFCHVYQIKGLCSLDRPSDIGMPIITFSLNEKKGKRIFSINYKGPHSNLTDYLFTDDLEKYLGKWLQAESTMTLARDGKLDVRISVVESGEVLCDIKDVRRDFWRDGATGIRPKWGLYRCLGDNYSLRPALRDETVMFADIKCRNTDR